MILNEAFERDTSLSRLVVDGDLVTIFDSSDLGFAKTVSRMLKITLFGELPSYLTIKPQVAQARNMSIGEHRHCCVPFKI